MTMTMEPENLTEELPGFPHELATAGERNLAITAIAVGITADELRGRSVGMPWEARDKALANDVEHLARRGLTMRAAMRVLRERDRANPDIRPFDETAARQAAMIFLTVTTDSGQLREPRGGRSQRRTFAMIADAMEALLAEGFDAVAFAEQMRAQEEASLSREK